MSERQPPTGSVTMLFTDIEGSTRLARALGDRWPDMLAVHHQIVRGAIDAVGGYIEAVDGDAFAAVFAGADAALEAAQSAQRDLAAQTWPDDGELRVRMGIHTGNVERSNGQYVGLEIHRAARVAAAAHGGQVLLTGAARDALTTIPPCDDLGGHRFKDFPEPTSLFHLVLGGRRAQDFPPPKTLDVRPTNLPPANTVEVGRDAEIDLVTTALTSEGSRLVTLTGLGGAGKTTAALAIGRLLLDDHPGGVWFVRAESIDHSSDLVPAIARVLWLRDQPGTDLLEAIAERFRHGPALLILDNLEHLDGAPQVVAALLDRTTGLRLLTTSRVPLRLTAERVVPIGSLPLEAATELLLRGSPGGHDSVTSREDPAVAALCERLDCLPLALGIVAPRLRILDAGEILARLESINDLTSMEVDRPERHRSVRTAVDWSVGLLSDPARALFRRMAAFVGAAPFAVVETVCGSGVDVVEQLPVLLDYSLVRREPAGFSLITAVREVAAEDLVESGEADEVASRHARAICELGERTDGFTHTAADENAVAALDIDSLTATEWASLHDLPLHVRLTTAFGTRWASSGQLNRALRESQRALDAPDIGAARRGALLRVRAYILAMAQQNSEAKAVADMAVEVLQHGPLVLLGLALVTQSQTRRDDPPAALAAAEAAVECFRELGDPVHVVRGLCEFAQAACVVGELAEADRALREARQLLDLRHHELRAVVLATEADYAFAAGDFQRAIEANAELLATDAKYVEWTVANMAAAFAQVGEPAVAAELFGIARAMAVDLGTDLPLSDAHFDGILAAVRAKLPADGADAAERAGLAIPAAHRIARARALAAMAR